ncbi:ricin-type beta-trefoil lectin domain protein [Nocardia sp. NPDC050406]|uniref:ricin-type beta-trefoil lectin domain protein n=1 Tax=Nocardia sp. NPDC050406 TaxID=3364318 RepID=UPI003791CD97
MKNSTTDMNRASGKSSRMARRRLGSLLGQAAALAAAAVMIGAPSSWAASTTLPNGLNPGLCLDAQTLDGRTLTGAVQMYACNGGRAQQWISGSGNSLRNGLNQALCLDAQTLDGRTLTGKVQMYACNGGRAQQWISGSGNSLRNGLNQGLCLDAQTLDGRTLTGKVQMYACNGGRAQQW